MKKVLTRLNRAGRRNAGIIAILGIMLALVFLVWPKPVVESVHEAGRSDFVQDLLGLLPRTEDDSNGTVREIQVKYDSGTLTHQGQVTASEAAATEFNAKSTAASGQAARFELVCGATVCASTGAPYQEPLTFFLVTVPPKAGVTKLTVTAGPAYLEVELA